MLGPILANVGRVRYQVTLIMCPKFVPGLAAGCVLPMLKPGKPENMSCLYGGIGRSQLVHCTVHLAVHKIATTVTLAEQPGKYKAMPLMLCACSFQVGDKLAHHIWCHRHPLVEGLYVARLELVLLLHMPKSAIPSVTCKQKGKLLVHPYTAGLSGHTLAPSLSCLVALQMHWHMRVSVVPLLDAADMHVPGVYWLNEQKSLHTLYKTNWGVCGKWLEVGSYPMRRLGLPG